jgi:hypothetical protein
VFIEKEELVCPASLSEVALHREDFLIKRVLGMIRLPVAVALVLACVACPGARGDVGVVLNESLDTSVARITGSGHTAVYLSRVCAETPVKLRLCRPGEQGSVLSNYTTLGEDQPFEWNVVPLNIYLYGVEEARNRPVFGSFKIKHVLEERYRTKYLSAYCQSSTCKTSYKAEWREMVAATMVRSVYIFVVDSTLEQDLDLIARLNALSNENHFNGATRNCADFVKRVINTYFPGATHRDFLNDFGMTSPKAIAHSFTHYADQHPEAHFRVFHFAQLPGTIKRSKECRSGTEQLYHSKKLLVPMLVFANHELPVVAASYVLTGRFNPEHVFEKHPAPEATETSNQIQLAKAQGDKGRTKTLETAENEERARVVGTSEEWKEYRAALNSITEEAVQEKSIPDHGYLNRLFKRLDKAGTPTMDDKGALWMEISDESSNYKVGLSASNILASGSDSDTAYELILARNEYFLKSPKHERETMPEFKRDWALLQSARARSSVEIASSKRPATTIHGAAVSAGGMD